MVLTTLNLATTALASGLGAVLGFVVKLGADRLSGARRSIPLAAPVALEALAGAWSGIRFLDPTLMLASLALSAGLLTLALVDMAVLRLPNMITLPLAGLGLLVAFLDTLDLWSRFVGAGVGYFAFAALALVYRRARGRDGLGMGDAKLLAAAGAWLGWRALPATVMIACGLAFAWTGVCWVRSGRVGLTEPLPFGAPLALGVWAVWIWDAPT